MARHKKRRVKQRSANHRKGVRAGRRVRKRRARKVGFGARLRRKKKK
jgi:hypothetical protein